MATPTLEGCTEKWARGSALLNKVIERVDEYMGTDPPPHQTSSSFDPATCSYVVTGETVRPLPEPLMLAVLLGDAIHNLRSALDHLIWQLVLLNTKKDGSTDNQFPICDSGPGYWSTGKNESPSMRTRRLKGVSKDHQLLIDTFQPYRNVEALRAGNLDPLSTLRDLSNHDKHRLLHVLVSAVDLGQDSDFRLVPNDDAGEQLDALVVPFPDQGSAPVITVKYSCPGPKPDVVSQWILTITAGVEASRLRLKDLTMLSDVVIQIIERFRPDFP
jgi:hypothetical protein